jgi:uncharacterized protein (DUF305 family)
VRSTFSRLLLVMIPALVGLLAVAGGAQARSHSYNATDAAFAAGMLPHHEGGVELGRLAAQKGVNADIRRLGGEIVTAQTREARTLRRMVRQFRTRAEMPEPIEERDMRDMRRLQAASGAEFDRLWLDVIGAHHAAAIQMAQIEAEGGRNAEARRLARRIVSTQERELAQFNRLAEALGG